MSRVVNFLNELSAQMTGEAQRRSSLREFNENLGLDPNTDEKQTLSQYQLFLDQINEAIRTTELEIDAVSGSLIPADQLWYKRQVDIKLKLEMERNHLSAFYDNWELANDKPTRSNHAQKLAVVLKVLAWILMAVGLVGQVLGWGWSQIWHTSQSKAVNTGNAPYVREIYLRRLISSMAKMLGFSVSLILVLVICLNQVYGYYEPDAQQLQLEESIHITEDNSDRVFSADGEYLLYGIKDGFGLLSLSRDEQVEVKFNRRSERVTALAIAEDTSRLVVASSVPVLSDKNLNVQLFGAVDRYVSVWSFDVTKPNFGLQLIRTVPLTVPLIAHAEVNYVAIDPTGTKVWYAFYPHEFENMTTSVLLTEPFVCIEFDLSTNATLGFSQAEQLTIANGGFTNFDLELAHVTRWISDTQSVFVTKQSPTIRRLGNDMVVEVEWYERVGTQVQAKDAYQVTYDWPRLYHVGSNLVSAVGVSPNGQWLAVGATNGEVVLWRITGTEIEAGPYLGGWSLFGSSKILEIAVTDNGEVIAYDVEGNLKTYESISEQE